MSGSWVKKSVEVALKGLLISIALYFIISRFENSGYQGIFSYHWHSSFILVPLFVFLWALNLLLDGLIWQTVNSFLGRISLKRAFKTNFVSYALAFVTPANSGELAGRYIMLQNNDDRQKALFLIFWSHFPRMAVKLVLGISGLLVLASLADSLDSNVAISLALASAGVLLWGYFSFHRIQAWLYSRNIRRFSLSNYMLKDRPRPGEKLRLLALAVSKYLTYNVQFILLLLLWGNVELSLELCVSVLVFYFVTTIIPTFAAVDFIVKAAFALYIFGNGLVDESLLVNAAFVIWVFNVAIPALVGLIIIMRSNLTTSIKKRFSRGSLYGP